MRKILFITTICLAFLAGCAEVSAETEMPVEPKPPVEEELSLSFDKNEYTLLENERTAFNVISSKKVDYILSIDDTSIAKIENNNILALQAGETYIKAKYNEKVCSAKIIVNEVHAKFTFDKENFMSSNKADGSFQSYSLKVETNGTLEKSFFSENIVIENYENNIFNFYIKSGEKAEFKMIINKKEFIKEIKCTEFVREIKCNFYKNDNLLEINNNSIILNIFNKNNEIIKEKLNFVIISPEKYNLTIVGECVVIEENFICAQTKGDAELIISAIDGSGIEQKFNIVVNEIIEEDKEELPDNTEPEEPNYYFNFELETSGTIELNFSKPTNFSLAFETNLENFEIVINNSSVLFHEILFDELKLFIIAKGEINISVTCPDFEKTITLIIK